MKLLLPIMLLLLVPATLSAAKKNTYAKIYKLVYVDGTTEYGSEEFKNTAEEKKFLDKKDEELDKEYKISMEEYKKAYAEYNKSKEKDKVRPAKVYKPSFRLEGRKYVSDKDREKMEKSIEKKNASAEKANAKLKK